MRSHKIDMSLQPMDSNQLPQDPAILMSYINTMLRDRYATLDELCEDLGIDREELVAKLAQAGFEYNASLKKFW